MTDFQRDERNRAFHRVLGHLHNAHALLLAAQHENMTFALNLTSLADIDRQVTHAITCCAHVYKQPPDVAA